MYQPIWRKRLNTHGFTFLEALLHLLILAMFTHFLVLIFGWIAQINNTQTRNEHVAWELFIQDVDQYFNDVKKVKQFIGKEQIEIEYVNSNKRIQINRYGDIIRLQTNDEGYVPLLVGIKRSNFIKHGNELTITVEFNNGIKKERTFYVQIPHVE